ncbi:MAG TPA: hypothetical protein DIU15_16655 [Deltaproteobacteria bacterium]|nr:hypothetical protein [Deltaproteobacteria bacterium]HCP47674.1 hypothetical protein [Deltaproteobacteria bacterium]
MSLARRALTYLLFPVVFFGALCLGGWALTSGADRTLVLVGIAVCTAALLAAVERVHPAYDSWKRSHGDLVTDAIHVGVSNALVPKGLELAILASLATLAADQAEVLGLGVWPRHWPMALQLVLAMVVGQLPEYWWHRLAHTVPLLWRFHAVHHSSQRLYWLNAARFHPIDTAVSYVLSFGTLTVLGASPEAMMLMAIWVAVHGLFQHCNVHLRLGPLNWIFSMAELHRWHHSLSVEEANNNYGNNILFWDIVFGTVYWPRDRDAAEAIGLADLPAFPQHYWGQLAAPFRWAQLVSESVEEPRPASSPE